MVNRPENVRTGITTDPHSPEEFRVNAPLSNFDPFYTTYKLTPKSRLWRKQEDRVKIW
jgi:putative endopeptidase